MQRTKYDEQKIRQLAKKYTLDEIVRKLNLKKEPFQNYCWRHEIRCIDYQERKSHSPTQHPIGYEFTRDDGMTLIKISHNKWEYKQRYLYEKYHNIKLPKNIMVIFLDRDRTNFDINNLKAVDTKEYNYIKNKDLLSNNPELNELSILTAKLNYKRKEVIENDKNTI